MSSGTRHNLVLLIAVISLCIGACGSDPTGHCIFNHMVGEMEFNPEGIPFATGMGIEVHVRVFLIGDGCKKPLEGAKVEIFSSRNSREETLDEIQQPLSHTDEEGLAVAYIEAKRPGEALITASADGAFLCESWKNNSCTFLARSIEFTLICGGIGMSECDGECVDLETDSDHCGRCGNACPTGTACAGGVCSCEDSDGDGFGAEFCGGAD
jgi:hypothetical protein